MDEKIEQESKLITKALAYTENGGAPNLNSPRAGKTGEMASIFQFTPDTWKHYSKEVLGRDTPLSADSEAYVVNEKVKDWLKKGYKPEQIFSMWNAGQGEPNAYTGKFKNGQQSVGVNKKFGVKYNVPQYVAKANSYMSQFQSGGGQDQGMSQGGGLAQAGGQPAQAGGGDGQGKNQALQNLMAIISQAKTSVQA